MIRMNLERTLQLQGDMTDTAFARKLGVSRSQLWRIRTKRSSVGADFIEKFMAAYPSENIDDYFFSE